MGVNVSNEHPTKSLNSILRDNGLAEWSCEMFIAKCINCLEQQVELLRNERTLDSFFEQYTKYWLHQYKISIVNEILLFLTLNF